MLASRPYRSSFVSSLKCPQCGTVQTVIRPTARRRARGHIKHLWCRVCKQVTGHVELGEFGEHEEGRALS